jgi:uncharacterized protein (TIGR02246 family)
MLKGTRLVAGVTALLLAGAAPPAAADAARADIKAALVQWKDDFNAGRADRVCDLFARDLRADFRGQPERGYDALCGLLRRSLADRARAYSYALAIKEILVWGDTAVVRLTWTLTVRPRAGGRVTTSVEPGLDLLRRQRDGHWRIVRYMAYAK